METVGEAAVRLLKDPDPNQSVVETQQAMQKRYVDNVIEAAERGKREFGSEKEFYVCVQTRRERLLTNVIRNQYYPRRTRPTPQYDLALYHFDPKAEQIRFVWCIPDKDTVADVNAGRIEVDSELRRFCSLFALGQLI